MDRPRLIFLLVLVLVFILVLTLVLVLMPKPGKEVSLHRMSRSVLLPPDPEDVPDESILIPRRIMQTYKSDIVQERMKTAIQNVQKAHPGFMYEYFNDTNARAFIADHFEPRVLEAFDILIPGAYKADVFRLCYLYVHGGWYIDISMNFNKNVEWIFEQIKERQPEMNIGKVGLVLVRDDPCTTLQYVYQAFLGSVPRHPIIKYILDAIVERVHARDMSEDCLSITGPGIFGRCLNRYFGRSEDNKHIIDGVFHSDEIVMLRHGDGEILAYDKVFAKTKYSDWKKDRTNSKHYSHLYRKGRVFNTLDSFETAKTNELRHPKIES